MGQYESFNFLINRLRSMDSDMERWKFIADNADVFIVQLDNDQTIVICDGDDREEPEYVEMDWYVGASDGVMNLMNTFEINAEFV